MKIVIAAVLAVVAVGASAQVHVNGYTKANGTYVAPHEKTAPNNTVNDNYSTKGNVNPYTGRAGTVPAEPQNPYATQQIQPLPSQQPSQPQQPQNIWAQPKTK